MDKYLTLKLKKHTLYDKKILFVMVNCKHFDMDENTMKDCIENYKNYIEQNEKLSIIYDARNLNSVKGQVAWKGASLICQLNGIAKKNVTSACLIMNNISIQTLFNSVTKIYPIIVPFKIVQNNNEALDFITSKMKEIN